MFVSFLLNLFPICWNGTHFYLKEKLIFSILKIFDWQKITHPSNARTWVGLILWGSCSGNHGYCEIMITKALSFPEVNIPLHSFPPPFLNVCWAFVGSGRGVNGDVLFRAEYSVFYSQYFEQLHISVLPDVHCKKKPLRPRLRAAQGYVFRRQFDTYPFSKL